MGTALVCQIGGVNYSKTQGVITGNDALISFEARPGSHGNIGSARISLLRKTGGAYAIISRQRVRIVRVNDATNIASAILFDGFVATDSRWAQAGYDAWYCDVDCSDLNILFDWVRVSADAFGVSSGGATTYGNQLLRLYSYATLNTGPGSPLIDPITSNSLFATTGLPAFSGLKGSLGEMTKKVSDNLNAVHPAIFPRYYLRSELSGTPGIYTSGPVLAAYDGAVSVLATDPVVAHFDVDHGGGTYTIRSYKRTKDGATLQTRTVAAGQRGSPPNEYQAAALSDSGQRSTYANPFDYENAWKGPPLQTPDNLSTGQIQAIADQALADLENPRETWEIETLDQAAPIIKPQDVIQLSVVLEGISAQRYRVVDNTFKYFMTAGGLILQQNITAGNRLRQMDESAWPGTGRVVEHDTIAPDAPTGLAIVPVEAGLDDFEAPGPRLRYIQLAWTPSTSDDAVAQRIWIKYSGSGFWELSAEIGDNTTAGQVITAMPNRSGDIYVHARDGSGNWGAYATVAFTTNPPAPAPTLANPDFGQRRFDDPSLPESWGITLAGAATADIDQTKALASPTSLRVDISSTGDTATILSERVAVINPTTTDIQTKYGVTFRLAYYALNASANIRARILWLKLDGSSAGTTTPLGISPPVATTNKKLENVYLPPVDTVAAQLELYVAGIALANNSIWFSGCLLQDATTSGGIKPGSGGSTVDSQTNQMQNPQFLDIDDAPVEADAPLQPQSWTIASATDGAFGRRIDTATLYGTTALELVLPGVVGANVQYASEPVTMQNVDLEQIFVNIKIAQEADSADGLLQIFYLWLDEDGASLGSPTVIYNDFPAVGPQVIKAKVQPAAHAVARQLWFSASAGLGIANTIRLVIMDEHLALTGDDLVPFVMNAGTYDVVTVSDVGLVTAGYMYVTEDDEVVIEDDDLVYEVV